MLLVDDLLTAPIKGMLWVFHEIHNAANEAQRARRDEIMAALSALYVSLEQGGITDDEFDEREKALLDELDELDARFDAEDADDDDEDEDEDEDNVSIRIGTDADPVLATAGTQSQAKHALRVKPEVEEETIP